MVFVVGHLSSFGTPWSVAVQFGTLGLMWFIMTTTYIVVLFGLLWFILITSGTLGLMWFTLATNGTFWSFCGSL